MATPLPTGDPARDALNMSEEILARLDAATAPQAESAAPSTDVPIEDQLQSIEARLNEAMDRSDKEAARQIVQEAKTAVRDEKKRREEAMVSAQEDFDRLLKAQGGAAEETMSAAKEVSLWTKSLNGYDEYIQSVDAFYDDAISGIDIDDGSIVTKMNAGKEQKPKQLAELLLALDSAEAAYRARLDELKVQKQDVAQQIIDARIAEQKAKIGA